jgi:hypothetical protein
MDNKGWHLIFIGLLKKSEDCIFKIYRVYVLYIYEGSVSFYCKPLYISGMDNVFLKSVYCLSGLGIVRKNRRLPKYFNSKEVFILS